MRNLFIGCAAVALASSAGHAQETTSSIRGTVTATGAPVARATVEIVHVPSGTRSATTTDANGTFTANGLRIGGPYSVSVDAAGFTGAQVTDINTIVGQPYDLPIELAAEAAGGQDIVVTASRLPNARTVSQGPVTVLGVNDIAKVASVNRDIRDLIRRDPFATLDTSNNNGRAVSFAGQNGRFNRFTIDGVPVNDSFGLNQDGLPSRRGPVPLDAIGQFQTKVAPYDIREGNFQGGVINAILRSGTNEFQGTGFYTYNDDSLNGKRTKPTLNLPTGRVPSDTKSQDYGAEISGPIIKDKLFFMIAGERVRADAAIQPGTTETNSGTPVIGLSDALLQRVLTVYDQRYGARDPGSILRTNGDKDDRVVGKLDANLSDTQRLAVTGIYTKDSIIVPSTTGNGSLGLESNAYVKPNRLWSVIAQLNSDWSDDFSTELRALHKDYKSGQVPLLGNSASFSICAAEQSDRTATGATSTNVSLSCPTGTPRVVIGPGGPSQSNILRVKTDGGSFLARLSKNDHNLRVLAEFFNAKTFNQFVNNNTGTYYFDSLADLAAGNAQQLTYQNAPSLDPVDAAARFTYQTYTFGIMDDWRFSDQLTISYGMRYDLYGGGSRPALNQNFFNRYGLANTSYISGRGLFQPRIGFDYRPAQRLSVRGGGGIFGGGTPDVYVGNSFSNSGVLASTLVARVTDGGVFQLNGSSAGTNSAAARTILSGVDINAVNALAQAAVAASDPTLTSTTQVNALDPNFKIPSQWRATLSADYRADLGALGDGWHFGVDGFFSKVRDQAYVTDLRSVPITGVGATTPDGRQRYRGLLGNADTQADYLLTNTDKGRSWIGVVRFDKSWDFGLEVRGSYTYQNVKDQAPLTSSQAGSLYGNVASLDANNAAYGISNDEVRHSFKYLVSFDHAFFGDNRTRVSLFGETRIGSPYSYTFQDASGSRSTVFGVTQGSSTSCYDPSSQCRYLFYVPTGASDPKVSYDSAATQARVEAIIAGSGLARYRGKIAPRNAFNSKWFTKLDLHLEQELPALFGTKISLFSDVENVSNLINRKWGQQLRTYFPFNKPVARVSCVATTAGGVTDPCGQYRYSAASTDAQLEDQLVTVNGSSLYAIRVGARFSF